MATDGADYSLRIMSGRIYRGCSLQLVQPSTPETKAIYCATMDGKDARLVATVPGVEVHLDSRSKYVLVDISPDLSLWPDKGELCKERGGLAGHEHLPIWPESVIIVCEEVDTLAQPAADTGGIQSFARHFSKLFFGTSHDTERRETPLRYNLRRVTTLGWDCRPAAMPTGPLSWLPFKPSLVHKISIACSALGWDDSFSMRSENVFCDPEVAADLLSQQRPHHEWPVYEIYLV